MMFEWHKTSLETPLTISIVSELAVLTYGTQGSLQCKLQVSNQNTSDPLGHELK